MKTVPMLSRTYLQPVACAALVAVLLASSPASALGSASAYLAAAGGLTLEQAVARIRREHGGRVVSATEGVRDGRAGYRVRVLTESGRVRTFWVDANEGGRRGRGRRG